MAQYAGESLAKKVARVRLYKRAREALKFRLPSLKEIKALFLIGDSASELGALKHILGVSPDRMVGVDRSSQACDLLRDKAPGVKILQGNLEDPSLFLEAWDFAAPTEGLHFMHLDLMGNLPKGTEDIYANWGDLCAYNGVCGVTFLRGRETPKQKSRFVHRLAREIVENHVTEILHAGASMKVLGADEERSAAHYLALQKGTLARRASAALGLTPDEMRNDGVWKRLASIPEWDRTPLKVKIGAFFPIATHAYRAEVSPMGVLLTQRMTFSDGMRPKWYANFQTGNGRLTTSIIKKDPMEDLLLEADSLAKEFTNAQVAEILDVSTGTLAAWRAHRTMGTYEAA